MAKKVLFDAKSAVPFKLSRSRLDLFMECPRCFYLEHRFGATRPSGPPFTLNNCFDTLMKREFDRYRAKKAPHPLMKKFGINAVPYQHPDLDTWRNNFQGITFLYKPANMLVSGAIDDIWVRPDGKLIIADYKATSTDKEIAIGDDNRARYRKQLEVYRWLFAKNGFPVHQEACLVYGNARGDRNELAGRFEFDLMILKHACDDRWVEPMIQMAARCLSGPDVPPAGEKCPYCKYTGKTLAVLKA